jgi:C4-dicarboxylate transporter/malic acid transport protein
MGTGILAIGVAASPVAIPFGPTIARALWIVDVALFATVLTIWLVKLALRPGDLIGTLGDAGTAQAWGAIPMAAFTVAVGFLRIGPALVDPGVCIAVAQTLFLAGVAGSMFTAFAVPYRMFTSHELTLEGAHGAWLLPVVPPIVASVPAALLSPTWPEALRPSMLALAYALLGIGVILAAILIVVFYLRLLLHKVPSEALVPTMWIVVGPLGQSIAGIIALGGAARAVWPDLGEGLATAALAYGVLVWGFAMYWLAMAIATTLRAVRRNLPFTLGWWAFTFPVGVLTAGTDALFGVTHAAIFGAASVALLALLATMWVLVAARSLQAMQLALAPGGSVAREARRGAR